MNYDSERAAPAGPPFCYTVGMDPDDIVHFLPSDELAQKSWPVFERYKRELEAMLPPADIQHVGSCAVPGLIGKFDVDIQVRTDRESFPDMVELCRARFAPKHPEIWKDDFALLCDNGEFLVDIIVTVAGTRHDDFCRVRDALIENPELLQEYNELKTRFEGKPYGEYKKAKREFFGRNGEVRFLKY